MSQNQEIENENSPKAKDDNRLLFLGLLVSFIIVLFVSWWNWLKEKRKKTKLKSEFSAEYGISQKVLMRWIELFCSKDYNKNYAHKNAKKIPQYDLYQHLGKPEPGKKFGKQELAEACFTHRNTLNSHLKQIPNFAEEIKISHKQYLSLRRLPPKTFHKIVKLHKQHFHDSPPTLIENL